MRFSNSLKWFAALAALAIGTADLAAQSSGTLMGRITGESGVAVSGAQVVITNQVTGSKMVVCHRATAATTSPAFGPAAHVWSTSV
mgnify:CR=1 FL=1